AVGLGVLAQPRIDQPQGLAGLAQGAGVDVEILLLRDMEQAQQRRRIVLEETLVWDRQPLAVEHETVEGALGPAPAQPGEAALALLVGFEDGAEDPRQIADILGDEKIALHEALDAAG